MESKTLSAQSISVPSKNASRNPSPLLLRPEIELTNNDLDSHVITLPKSILNNVHNTLEDDVDDEKKEIDKVVSVCCSNSSLFGLKYISRIVISSSILLFSFSQIYLHSDSDNSIYFSLISSILGYYLSTVDYKKK